MKWPCMRLVSTSRKTGPSPERACSSASRAASKTASTSWPSTLIARMSYASARFDMSSQTGECCQPGVDSAQWLFSQTKTVFVFQSCARLSDSWKVPMFVAPSPKKATATRGSSRSLNARPAPTIAGRPPPMTAFAPMLPRSTS